MRTRSKWHDITDADRTAFDELNAQERQRIDTIPTVIRRRSPAEVRDHHLSHARASLIALGLPDAWVSSIMDEAERLTESR